MVEINKCVGRPEKVAEIFASNEFTGVPDKVHENAEGLFAKSHIGPVPAQLSVACINLEDAKTPDPGLMVNAQKRFLPPALFGASLARLWSETV